MPLFLIRAVFISGVAREILRHNRQLYAFAVKPAQLINHSLLHVTHPSLAKQR